MAEDLGSLTKKVLERATRAEELAGTIESMIALVGRIDHVVGVCDSSRRDISGPIKPELIRAIVISGIDTVIRQHEKEIRDLICINGIDQDVAEKGA